MIAHIRVHVAMPHAIGSRDGVGRVRVSVEMRTLFAHCVGFLCLYGSMVLFYGSDGNLGYVRRFDICLRASGS